MPLGRFVSWALLLVYLLDVKTSLAHTSESSKAPSRTPLSSVSVSDDGIDARLESSGTQTLAESTELRKKAEQMISYSLPWHEEEDANREISKLLRKINRLREAGSKVVEAIFDIAKQVGSAHVHVNVSSILWSEMPRTKAEAQTHETALVYKMARKRRISSELHHAIVMEAVANTTRRTTHLIDSQSQANAWWWGGGSSNREMKVVNRASKQVSNLLERIVAEQEGLSFLHSSKPITQMISSLFKRIVWIRSSLTRLVSRLDIAHDSLNTTNIRVAMLEALRVRVDKRSELEKMLRNAQVDYETGMLRTKNGSTNVSINDVVGLGVLGVKNADVLSDPAQMYTDIPLLLSMMFLIGAAAVGGALVNMLGLPETFGYILGGVVVGPSDGGAANAANAGVYWLDFHVLSSRAEALRIIFIKTAINQAEKGPYHSEGVETIVESGENASFDNDADGIDKCDICDGGFYLGCYIARRRAHNRDRLWKLFLVYGVGVYEALSARLRSWRLMRLFFNRLQTAKRHYVREILISTLATSLGRLLLRIGTACRVRSRYGFDPDLPFSKVGFGTALAAATSIEHFRIFRFLPFITKLPPSGVKAINDAVNIEAAIDYKRKALDEPSAKTSRTYSSGGGLEILVPIAICLASSFTTRVILGLSLEIGAFIAGVLVAKHISVDMGTLRTVFGGVLFASIGTIVNPRFLLANSHLVFLALVAVYSLKISNLAFTLSKTPMHDSLTVWGLQ
eukprot:jgi/Bigna1/80252/fgenesh1_pg.69_\